MKKTDISSAAPCNAEKTRLFEGTNRLYTGSKHMPSKKAAEVDDKLSYECVSGSQCGN
jgi:hypothetical protein